MGNSLLSDRVTPEKKAAHPLKILILGGTSFLGPHQIAYAMNRGHQITTFTRGKTEPTIYKKLFKEVEELIGDREDNLEALKGRKWDAVIDNSGRREKWTKDTAELLKDNVDLYLYTSSTGVYYPYLGSNIKEDTKLVLEVPDGINDYQKMEYGYGVMKTRSENVAKKIFGDDRTIIVRPTYMMGPADRTDRFSYWPVRLSRGGEVLVPGKNEDPVQYIDVRDVAGYMIRLIENRKSSTSNAVGPASATGMQAFVHGVHAAFSSPVSFVSIPNYQFLEEHDITDIIPWIAPIGENVGSALVNNERAIANGLTFTPLAKSVMDIYDWWHSDAVTEERRIKMVEGKDSIMRKEKDILATWKKQKQ
ncbi:MAG: hypothetical protein DHS20C18_16070 [Saprospiraceae bacterium]|nr:MAG: hypothetical protein DHS20C18_16070 [Saprospiraceae bacterium]